MAEQFSPVEIGSMKLEHPVMVGAGKVKTLEDVKKVAKSRSSTVLAGSITLHRRDENEGITFFEGNGYALNSKGLPNPGAGYYVRHLHEMVLISHDYGKPFILSVAGFSPEEYAILAMIACEYGADAFELNLGCPNAWGEDGKQKRIASFSEDLASGILDKVESEVGKDVLGIVKLSVFSDPYMSMIMCKLISRYRSIKAVTTMNTFPNAYSMDEQMNPVITAGNGLAGMSGEAVKPMAQGQVKQVREHLDPRIKVIGGGGIRRKRDVQEFLKVGASAVQISTQYFLSGPRIFARVLGEE